MSTSSNSERAKAYRVRHRQRALELTAAVATARDDVRQLHFSAQILRALVDRGVHRAHRDRILTHVQPFLASPAQQLVMPGFDIHHVELQDTDGYGCRDAPVVQIRTVVRGKHPPASLEAVYQFFPGNSVLLDTLMHNVIVYPCVVRYFFSVDGVVATAEVELDWITGLLDVVGGLVDVVKIAGPLRDLGDPFVITSFNFSC